jgi:UDP-glucose 4-epimerase
VRKRNGRKAVLNLPTAARVSARVVASSQKIDEELGWKAEYSLEPIIDACGNGIVGKGEKGRRLLLQGWLVRSL